MNLHHDITPERIAQLIAIRDAIRGTSAMPQRQRLLEAMRQLGHVTTFEASRFLDIYHPVTDRRNGARDVRRNGASFWLLNRAPEGVEERGYFAAFAGLDLTLPAAVLGARYEAPSRTMQ